MAAVMSMDTPIAWATMTIVAHSMLDNIKDATENDTDRDCDDATTDTNRLMEIAALVFSGEKHERKESHTSYKYRLAGDILVLWS